MKRAFLIKYLVIFLIYLIFIAGLIYAIEAYKIRDHYVKMIISDLNHLGSALMPSIEYFFKSGDYVGLDKFIKEIGGKIETRITIIDAMGKVIADSRGVPSLMENHRGRPEVEAALKGNVGSSMRYSSTVHEDMLYVAIPIMKDKKVVYVLRLSVFFKNINVLIGKLREDVLSLLLLWITITIAIFFLVSLKWSKSIENLTELTKKISAGDFNSKILIRPADEFKDLTNNFNFMTEKIRSLFEELKYEKEQLRIIIDSINEFLLVINGSSKIVMCNKSFRDYIKEEVEGRYYWEIIRNNEFGELVKRIWEDSEKSIIELELSGKIYTCSGVKLRLRDEAVFILTDVSHLYMLEKIKKDLIANVSHELRTPLTAIKGYIETIEQEAEPHQQSYISIIKKHTERLIKIVNNLLSLSYLENKGATIEFKKIHMRDLIKNIEVIFQNKAKSKNLILDINVEENLPEIMGDEIQLENMLINLVENAINYTEKGRVSIDAKMEGDFLKIEVSDTGVGIPEESIDRIFERFYVIDKSRSRKAGGSGLGLSIVKHIVLMHNGTIEVKSKIGEGSTFIIKLRAQF